jgi:mitochondrial fission protein ELM1
MRAGAWEERSAPERVVLDVRPGSRPDPRPPVRLFLGTEPAQERAERVFFWSVERVRNPSRRYEIWLLKGLSGFRRRGWTTGFTNYRFAIPHFAGGAGRAVYNDVDQIYLADPAELFDAELGGHGFLAVAPDDPSVMLLDCARMAGVWTLEAARQTPKAELLGRALAVPGLPGRLPPEWNARDDEYAPGHSKCLHFTTLHTQPWRPFPERFVYLANPRAPLWLGLEAEADRRGYRVFTRERPSARYREAGREPRLEETPGEDLPWRLDELFRHAQGRVRIEVACEAPRSTDPAGERARTPEWWCERIEAVATAHPGVGWEALLGSPDGRRFERAGGRLPGGALPRVWVLTDDRGGNSTQSLGLAEALGWPYERKSLRPGPLSRLHNRLLGASRAGISRRGSDPLEPPWPDLVIAAGRRTAPVALWVRAESRGRARLVQLGRKGGDVAERFDLVATPTYCRLFPHPRRVETCAPLHPVTPARLADAREHWRARFAALPSPRIVVLVGGSSGQYRIDAAQAARLGADAARAARALGGSLLATTSRRTARNAVAAFCAALGPEAFVWRAGDAGENPYLGLLAWADRIVVTADSESMLAEAASTGTPIWIYPLAERASFRVLRWPRDLVTERALARPSGPRGTPRPQRGLERLCGRLVEQGLVRPARDLRRLHEELARRGLAEPFPAAWAGSSGTPGGGTVPTAGAREPLRDAELVAARVRDALGIPEPRDLGQPDARPRGGIAR